MNKYEKVCRDWLKDCPCPDQGYPDPCHECTSEFLKRLHEFKEEESQCHIYGSEIDFSLFVRPDKIKSVCQEIWDHPSKYSDYQDNSDRAYYNFLKFL